MVMVMTAAVSGGPGQDLYQPLGYPARGGLW